MGRFCTELRVSAMFSGEHSGHTSLKILDEVGSNLKLSCKIQHYLDLTLHSSFLHSQLITLALNQSENCASSAIKVGCVCDDTRSSGLKPTLFTLQKQLQGWRDLDPDHQELPTSLLFIDSQFKTLSPKTAVQLKGETDGHKIVLVCFPLL